jgi:hypothetical protein
LSYPEGRGIALGDRRHEHDALAGNGRTYDLTIYGIIKFFNLAMENNPNVIDSLFTPVNCVLHITRVGNLVRENRRLFLHKASRLPEAPTTLPSPERNKTDTISCGGLARSRTTLQRAALTPRTESIRPCS